MYGGAYETGWLELKAEDFEVEPTQHAWIAKYLGMCPLHFLIARGPVWVLVDAQHHLRLKGSMSTDALIELSGNCFERLDRGALNMKLWLSACLKERTYRRRVNA